MFNSINKVESTRYDFMDAFEYELHSELQSSIEPARGHKTTVSF